MLELRAKNYQSSVQIIERFVDGVRFIKIIPRMMMPMIMENLKKMFEGKPVEYNISEQGWIRIKKLNRDETMENSVKQSGLVNDNDEVDEAFILKKEAEMLERLGFEVKVKEVEDG